jgi:hypothetical protein
VEVVHEFGEVLCDEVVGAEACVEAGESEVDGIGPGGDGGSGAVPISCGGEEFGSGIGGVHGGLKHESGWKESGICMDFRELGGKSGLNGECARQRLEQKAGMEA